MMVSLPRTHGAVCDLLDLMRCDSCSSALHQPFTTGICEHLLCPSCVPNGQNTKCSGCCPVCSIPVQPKDCQLHPQFASLVLIARRMKKLTVDNSNSPQNLETNNMSDELSQNLPSKFNELVDMVRNNASVKPNLTMKRAYSTNLSVGDLKSKRHSQVTLKRCRPSSHLRESGDNSSINSQYLSGASIISGSSQTNSVIYRPCVSKSNYDPDQKRQHQSRRVISSNVKRLPAYSCSNSHVNLSKSASSLKLSQSPPDPDHHLTSVDSLVTSRSIVRNNSGLRHESPRKSPSDSLIQMAPIASPEPSHLADITNNSNLDLCHLNTSVCLSPVHVKTETNDTQPKRRTKFVFGSKSSSAKKENSSSNGIKGVELKKEMSDNTKKMNFMNKLRPNSKGESVLHRAAIRGDIKMIEQLLMAKFSPDIRDHAGWTPLHEAAIRGHCEVAQSLLNAGASVDIPGGPDLETPLHEAAQNGHLMFCELLVSRGANPLYPNANGLNAVQLLDSLISQSSNSDANSKKPKFNVSCVTTKCSVNKRKHQTELPAKIDIVVFQKIRELLDKTALRMSQNTITGVAGSSFTAANKSVSASTFIERRRLRPVLLATGLTRSQQSLFNRVANMIHARVVTSITPEVTHVVTGALQEIPIGSSAKLQSDTTEANEDVGKRAARQARSKVNDNSSSIANATCPRTLKFLNAVLQGCWILSFDWIETCAHVKMRVEEGGFEVTGCSTAPSSGAPCRARLSKEAGSCGLFHGMRVCFLGEFFYPVPSRDELGRLARAGEAIVLFSREKCSPIRLARLAIESLDSSSHNCGWELDENVPNSDGEFSPKSIRPGAKLDIQMKSNNENVLFGDSNHTNSLIVFYDPGVQSVTDDTIVTGNDNNNLLEPINSANVYALDVVKQASRLLKPCDSTKVVNPICPLKPVPCTWLLNCAAEYRLIPFPDVFL